MPFQPGQSGNPKGRPKGLTFSGILRKKLLEIKKQSGEKGKKITRWESIAETAINLSEAGDMQAIKFVASYTDGLPVARHEVGIDGEMDIAKKKLSKAELAEELKRRGLPDVFKVMDE